MELKDTFGRVHDYLRISLTDVCNFRCLYCLPEEKIEFMPHPSLMTAEEINFLSSQFVKHGVKKIRLTGGEPLMRKDAGQIIQSLSKFPVELTITTNGARVHEFIDVFKTSGIRSVNLSLDTLDEIKFRQITKRNYFTKVYENIFLLLENGFHVKINCVVMRGINDNELNDFIELTKASQLHVRFIEFMPFPGNRWKDAKVMSHEEILSVVGNKYQYVKLINETHDTAKKYFVPGFKGTFACITTMSEPFCSGCNRLRLTADGKMRNCLFSKTETDLLTPLREGKDLTELIWKNVSAKFQSLGGNENYNWPETETNSIRRTMMSIGG